MEFIIKMQTLKINKNTKKVAFSLCDGFGEIPIRFNKNQEIDEIIISELSNTFPNVKKSIIKKHFSKCPDNIFKLIDFNDRDESIYGSIFKLNKNENDSEKLLIDVGEYFYPVLTKLSSLENFNSHNIKIPVKVTLSANK